MKKIATLLLVLVIFCGLKTVSAYQYQGPEVELINLINSERAKNGAEPLTINWEVARLAIYKSEEMTRHGLFSHESLVYGSPAQQLKLFQVPHSIVGANIAMGQETAQEVLEAWKDSPSHYANLVNADYTSAGAGLSFDENGIHYWTLILVKE